MKSALFKLPLYFFIMGIYSKYYNYNCSLYNLTKAFRHKINCAMSLFSVSHNCGTLLKFSAAIHTILNTQSAVMHTALGFS